jgi:phosphoglycerol transferase MdoB-like AlkP superfamily enzyme
MNEYVVSIVIYLLFLLVSLYFRKLVIQMRSVWIAIIFIIVYFIATWFYFELINRAHQVLRSHGIYIDFGHASLLLLEIFAICILTAIIISISIAVTRFRSKQL